MTVKELVTQLLQFDPEMEVRIKGTDPTDWEYQNDIEGVSQDDSNWEDEMNYDEGTDKMTAVQVILIDGGMF